MRPSSVGVCLCLLLACRVGGSSPIGDAQPDRSGGGPDAADATPDVASPDASDDAAGDTDGSAPDAQADAMPHVDAAADGSPTDVSPDSDVDATGDAATDASGDSSATDAAPDAMIDAIIDSSADGGISIGGLDCLAGFWQVIQAILESIDREGSGGTCPSFDREGLGAMQTLTLTWDTSCDWTGAIVLTLERVVAGVWSVSMAFDHLEMDGTTVDGSLTGTYTVSERSFEFTADDLTFSGGRTCTIDGTGTATIDTTNFGFEADMTINGSTFVATGLSIHREDFSDSCVVPYAGTLAYTAAGGFTATVAFDASSPVDGTVDITVGSFTYEDADYCEFVSGG